MEKNLKHPTPSLNDIPDDAAQNQEIRIVMQSEVAAFQPTPLHLASKNGDIETVRALLEKNTSACLVYNNNEFIPLHYANRAVEGMEEEIEIQRRLGSRSARGTMMSVAIVIAMVTFQAGVNPAGGFWQQDTEYNSNNYGDDYYYTR
ncbi:hypothetical protein SDJN03_21831, partial [Cucurbita argyrosperma subsp. sororia]